MATEAGIKHDHGKPRVALVVHGFAQALLEAGRFAVKTDTAKNGHDYRQTFFTPKGVHWVAGQWSKHQEAQATQQEAAHDVR